MLVTTYNNQEVEISSDNKTAESEIVNTYVKDDWALVLEKKVEGVNPQNANREYEFYVYYYDNSNRTYYYLDAAGNKQKNFNGTAKTEAQAETEVKEEKAVEEPATEEKVQEVKGE